MKQSINYAKGKKKKSLISSLAFQQSFQHFYFSHFIRETLWTVACLLFASLPRGKYTIIHL